MQKTYDVVNKLSDILNTLDQRMKKNSDDVNEQLKTLDKRTKETSDIVNEQFKTLDKRMKEIEKKKFWALI